MRADEPVSRISRAEGRWRLVTGPRGEPLGWLDTDALPGAGTAGEAALEPVRPLRDEDSLLSALNEAVSSPAAAVARVTSDGVLAGLTSREAVHDRAGRSHAEAGGAAAKAPTAEADSPDGADASGSTPTAGAATAGTASVGKGAEGSERPA